MFKNHPKGLLQAALSNMGERFGYYIMIAVLTLFLCSKFGVSDETSSLISGFFLAAIYIMSLVGGIIADRTQNYQRTIESGLIIMSLGYVCLSVPVMATPQNNSYLLASPSSPSSSSHAATDSSRAICKPLSDRCTTTSRQRLPRRVPKS